MPQVTIIFSADIGILVTTVKYAKLFSVQKINSIRGRMLLLCIIYVIFTLPSLFSSHHILFNLEPYPDGLLYIQPALNVAAGKGFGLVHDQHFLVAWVPPFYSLVLAVGYLV